MSDIAIAIVRAYGYTLIIAPASVSRLELLMTEVSLFGASCTEGVGFLAGGEASAPPGLQMICASSAAHGSCQGRIYLNLISH